MHDETNADSEDFRQQCDHDRAHRREGPGEDENLEGSFGFGFLAGYHIEKTRKNVIRKG